MTPHLRSSKTVVSALSERGSPMSVVPPDLKEFGEGPADRERRDETREPRVDEAFTVDGSASLQAAHDRMRENGKGLVVAIDRHQGGVGTLTDSELRQAVLDGAILRFGSTETVYRSIRRSSS